MFVCLCNAVTTSQIVRCVRAGSADLEAVIKELGVGLNCGTCINMVEEIIKTTKTQNQVLASHPAAVVAESCDSQGKK